jgi:hypothetical protein
MFQPKISRFRRLKPEIAKKTIKQSFVEIAISRSYGPELMENVQWNATYQFTPSPSDDVQKWPMSTEEFQNKGFLEPGDVLLTTRLKSFFSFLVKRVDRSAFAHAGLVFLTPKHQVGVDRTYFIETNFHGVSLEGFAKIAPSSQPQADAGSAARYVVGVKRLESEWVTPSMRNMVAGRMLRFINDDNYNFSLLAALATPIPDFWFWLRDTTFGRAPTVRQYTRKKSRFSPVEFICSGFVQYAYVDMVRVSVDQGLLKRSSIEKAWNDVFFANWVTPDTSMEELIAVRPAELANSPKLSWKYLIFDGKVYRVHNNNEADLLLRQFEAEANGRSAG